MFIVKILGLESMSDSGLLLPNMLRAADRVVTEGIIPSVSIWKREEGGDDRLIFRVSRREDGIVREKADDADIILKQMIASGAR